MWAFNRVTERSCTEHPCGSKAAKLSKFKVEGRKMESIIFYLCCAVRNVFHLYLDFQLLPLAALHRLEPQGCTAPHLKVLPHSEELGQRFLKDYLFIEVHIIKLTIAKLYPIQRLSHPLGQSGIFISWLWTAMTLAVVSQTAHLKIKRSSKIHLNHIYCRK